MIDSNGSGDEKKTGPGSWNLGTWIVVGVGVGGALGAVADFLIGMGVGAAVGAAIGAVQTYRNRDRSGG